MVFDVVEALAYTHRFLQMKLAKVEDRASFDFETINHIIRNFEIRLYTHIARHGQLELFIE